jgi:hypothetical protein
MALRIGSTFNVISNLLKPNALPPLPTGLSYEVKPSEAGGAFTGNVVVAQPRTTTGVFNNPAFKQFLSLVPAVLGAAPSGGSSLLGTLGTVKTALQANNQNIGQPLHYVGRIPIMGFADGDSGFFGSGGFLGGINDILQGPVGQNLLNFGTQYALQSLTAEQGTGRVPVTMADTLPAVGRVGAAGRAIATVGRRFFDKFPNLATAIQGYRNMGKNVSRGQLWSLMKRFGPDFLITGGILTAAAVSELAMAGPGRRRMNPGNVKALRRAHRRMKSFHHVCQTNDHLLHARRRSTRRSEPLGRSIVQVK